MDAKRTGKGVCVYDIRSLLGQVFIIRCKVRYTCKRVMKKTEHVLFSQNRCNKTRGSWHQAISSNGPDHHESLNQREPETIHKQAQNKQTKKTRLFIANTSLPSTESKNK